MELKKIASILCFFIVTSTQAQIFKVTTYDENKYLTASKLWQYKIGKPAKEFPGYATRGAKVYFLLDWNKANPPKTKSLIVLRVYQIENGKETFLSTEQFAAYPDENNKVYARSGYQIGDYIAYVTEQDDEKKVFASVKFSVKKMADPDNGTGTVWACEDVDKNWNPIGVKKTLKVGECTNFCLKMPRQLDEVVSLGWEIYKVNEKDGTDTIFVDRFEQSVQAVKVRYFATTTKLCPFNEKGKYRIYATDWNSTNATYSTGNLKNYYGKMEIVVQ